MWRRLARACCNKQRRQTKKNVIQEKKKEEVVFDCFFSIRCIGDHSLTFFGLKSPGNSSHECTVW